jgi:hypothetical protein
MAYDKPILFILQTIIYIIIYTDKTSLLIKTIFGENTYFLWYHLCKDLSFIYAKNSTSRCSGMPAPYHSKRELSAKDIFWWYRPDKIYFPSPRGESSLALDHISLLSHVQSSALYGDSSKWRFPEPKEWKEFIEVPDNPDEMKKIRGKIRTGVLAQSFGNF